MKSRKPINYATKKMLNWDDKDHRDHLLRHWGVSIHQLKAAIKMANSHSIKLIEAELKRKGAI